MGWMMNIFFNSYLFFLLFFFILTFCNFTNGKIKCYVKSYNGNYTNRRKIKSNLLLLKENEKEVKTKIVKFPNPVLRTKCEEVLNFDENLKKTIRGLFDILYESKVVALTAPQVNVNKKIIIWNGRYEKRKEENEKVFINPTIVERSLIKKRAVEHCLSCPDVEGKVGRPVIISVSYFDILGRKHLKILKGSVARLFQHKYDHVNGILFFDRMTQYERKKIKAKLNLLRRQYKTDICDKTTDKCNQ